MNARQTIVDILERGEAELVVEVNGGVVTDVTVGGLAVKYTLHDYDLGIACEACYKYIPNEDAYTVDCVTGLCSACAAKPKGE